MSSPVPRRERLRQATLEEIKQTAHAQLAEQGPGALSLRAVARAMGMTASALYRYVDSRETLLAELIADGFASLADDLAAAFAAADPDDHPRRWLQVARAHRRWALDHSIEYALMFGPRVPGPTSVNDRVIAELCRSVDVLFRCMIEATRSGRVDVDPVDAQLTPAMRASLEAWGRDHELPLRPADLAQCLAVWTELHGFMSLEVFGHLPVALGDVSDLFDRQMADLFARIWREEPAGEPTDQPPAHPALATAAGPAPGKSPKSRPGPPPS